MDDFANLFQQLKTAASHQIKAEKDIPSTARSSVLLYIAHAPTNSVKVQGRHMVHISIGTAEVTALLICYGTPLFLSA